jgi:hypothetical protein
MKELLTQQDYWNSRAAEWPKYDIPLIPSPQDIEFMGRHLVPGGDALILGATPELCSLALDTSDSVTAVDFAEDVIEALATDGVDYINKDWNGFFAQTTKEYDNIMTDGGLLCLEFPGAWQQIANNIQSHLRPKGVFSARVYISTGNAPEEIYDNPNLNRFITSIANVDSNFTIHPKHPDYQDYDVRYALPPEDVVLRTFGKLALVETMVPNYEAGEHFISYAWQRST